MVKQKVGWPKQLNNNMGVQSEANLTGTTVSSKLVASQIVMLQQPHLPWEVDQKLGPKSPPVWVTSNLSTTSYHLIKARAKQCPTTLRKEDQGMTLLENGKEHLISQDEWKWWSLAIMLNTSPSDKKIGRWRHLGWISIQGKEGSIKLGQSNEEHWGEACWNASFHSKPQSMHKCVEKEVPGMRRDQLLVRQLVADSSYKKWQVGAKPPKRFTSYKRRTQTRWATMPPIKWTRWQVPKAVSPK